MPCGAVLPFAGSAVPSGFLPCDGRAVSRTTYCRLFDVVGTTYGSGDGSTTFNLPDMGGRVISGVSESRDVGSTGGSDTVTLTTDQLPAHTHTGTSGAAGAHTHAVSITDPGHSHATNSTSSLGLMTSSGGTGSSDGHDTTPGEPNVQTGPTALTVSSATTGITATAAAADSHTHTFTTDATGGGEAVEVVNPYIAMTYMIKME